MPTIETRPFGHTATSFGQQYIEIPGICVLFLQLTSYGASVTQYVRPIFQILLSPPQLPMCLHTLKFSKPSRCNMVVLAPCLMGTPFGRLIVLQCTKKWSRRTRQAISSIISDFEYGYKPKNCKKKKKDACHRHFNRISTFIMADGGTGNDFA